MDRELMALIDGEETPQTTDTEFGYRIVQETGEVEIETSRGLKRHMLKPLDQLYCDETTRASLDTNNDRDLALLLCIELEILKKYNEDPALTDGMVALALDRLCLNASAAPGDDELCRQLQLALRFHLSVNNFSKSHLKQALRMVLKSVERHSKRAGTTGYLEFIRYELQEKLR